MRNRRRENIKSRAGRFESFDPGSFQTGAIAGLWLKVYDALFDVFVRHRLYW